jgi:hypothetical protein
MDYTEIEYHVSVSMVYRVLEALTALHPGITVSRIISGAVVYEFTVRRYKHTSSRSEVFCLPLRFTDRNTTEEYKRFLRDLGVPNEH